jgi:heme-dependent oxidative N-demethylase alpha subunit-like protein
MSLSYFPLDGNDFRFTLGLRALKDRSWLHEDQNFRADLVEKDRVLAKYYDHVVATHPGSLLAQQKIFELVRSELQSTSPKIECPVPFKSDEIPIVVAARHVQEDLVLMRESNNGYILMAACVCFPTGWNLQEKVGKPLMAIHDPVPDLNARIGNPIDRFFQNLKEGKKVERFNWGLYDCADLFQPAWFRDAHRNTTQIDSENIGQKVFFRVERQTLQRLSNSKDILFTIRIFTNTLDEVVSEKERASKLFQSMLSMPGSIKKYKSINRFETQLMAYLKAAST